MTPNKRDLKAYVRYDGSGRVVAGSLILRRQKPKVGRWKEIQGYECCNPNTTLTYVDPTLVDPIIQITCNRATVFEFSFSGDTFEAIEDFVVALNENAGTAFLGTFTYVDDALTLNINYDIAKGLCPNGILTMNITD